MAQQQVNPPAIWKQGSPPDQSGPQQNIIPMTDDLWVDIVNHLVKRCTAINPYVWTSIEGGGGGGPAFSDAETPGGAINGVNVTFTLAVAPSPGVSLLLFLNGVLQTPGGVDYTLSGSTITYASAPPTGSKLIAWYRH